jgi:hypothetical protein
MLFGGYTAPNLLKWHWWRFNGPGFCAGMLAGVVGAIVVPFVARDLPAIYAFPFVLLLSTIAAVVVCLLTRPTDPEVLDRFYLTIRPWGWWGPVRERLQATNSQLAPNRNFRRDMFNCSIGILWQTSLVLAPIDFVLHNYQRLAAALGVLVVTSVILKFSWYDRLEA